MTKAEFIKTCAKVMNVHITEASDNINELYKIIVAELLAGGEVPLPGIGKLKAKHTKERKGTNPRTGAAITIPAGMRVTFMPSKELKDALKGA